jgi:hypothetical protein
MKRKYKCKACDSVCKLSIDGDTMKPSLCHLYPHNKAKWKLRVVNV